jgi:prevent-host-death family protein
MKQIGVYEAKTHLPSLLEEVEAGETITIPRHGKPVAKLVPVQANSRSIDETIAAIHEFRKRHPLNGITVKELIEEGRKH